MSKSLLTPFKVSLLSVSIALSGCLGDARTEAEKEASQSNTEKVRGFIEEQNLQGDPTLNRELPSISDPLPQLGMQLFFSKTLSAGEDVACASCHHPKLAGGDGLSLPIGVEAQDPDLLGPGRDHSSTGTNDGKGPLVPRNSPTTFNVAVWDEVLFHDGRVESLNPIADANGAGTDIVTPDSSNRDTADANAGDTLTQAQARFPVTSDDEMKGYGHDDLDNDGIRKLIVDRLQSNNEVSSDYTWLHAFRDGFEDQESDAETLITEANIFKAIAEYERSQLFVNSPWREFVVDENDDAISSDAKKGALIFFRDTDHGGANCASCHSGDFFTDEGFHNIAIPQVGRGKGEEGDGDIGSEDQGRFLITNQESDKYKFRTPSLLNIEKTAPYGHSGAFDSLKEMITYHLNPQEGMNNYVPSDNMNQDNIQVDEWNDNTQPALDALLNDQDNAVEGTLENVELSDSEIDQLIAFLETLTDTCVEGTADDCNLEDWVPDEDLKDPDGNRLIATFQ